jgi:hypothetical protein
VIENQYFTRVIPRADQHPLEFRHGAEKLFAVRVGAEAHDAFHACAIVPAAVEQHDFSGPRQVRDITLKIPLRAFAFGGSGQCDNPTDTRVQPLGNPLDDTALPGRIASFEEDDQFELLVDNPILQFDQFSL